MTQEAELAKDKCKACNGTGWVPPASHPPARVEQAEAALAQKDEEIARLKELKFPLLCLVACSKNCGRTVNTPIPYSALDDYNGTMICDICKAELARLKGE